MAMTVRPNEYLRILGFNMLTGEACGYGMRILTDVTEDGRKILQGFLGVSQLKLNPNYNSGSEWSFMMAPQMIVPLAIFGGLSIYTEALYSERHDEIAFIEDKDYTDLTVAVSTPQEDRLPGDKATVYKELYATYCGNVRSYRAKSGPREGDRMVHQMSGRVQ